MKINAALYICLNLICYFSTICIALLTERQIKNFPLRFNTRTLALHKQIDRALFMQVCFNLIENLQSNQKNSCVL